MVDKPPYCTIPKIFGASFAAWFELNFVEVCHQHDREYGINTMTSRWRADANMFFGIWSSKYNFRGKNKWVAVAAWIICRISFWRYNRNKIINGVAVKAPWFFKL